MDADEQLVHAVPHHVFSKVMRSRDSHRLDPMALICSFSWGTTRHQHRWKRHGNLACSSSATRELEGGRQQVKHRRRRERCSGSCRSRTIWQWRSEDGHRGEDGCGLGGGGGNPPLLVRGSNAKTMVSSSAAALESDRAVLLKAFDWRPRPVHHLHCP